MPGESSAEGRDSGDPQSGKVSSSKLPLIFLISELLSSKMAFPGGSSAGDVGSAPELRRFPWRRKRQPTPGFLPGKSHGQRNLAGYIPWGPERLGFDLVTKLQ